MDPNPNSMRQRRPRVHPAFCVLAVFAALGSPARALEEPYPAQITPPADLVDLPSTLIVDDGVLTAPPDANFIINSNNGHELRLRHRHLHKRQKEEKEEEDEEDTDKDKVIVKNKDSDEISRAKEEEGDEETATDEATKAKDGDGHKTRTTGDEKETSTATSDDKDDEKESKTAAPTKTLTEDPDSLTTHSLSAAPSSTVPTETADPDAPLPVPFDGTSSSEFKMEDGDDSCPDFIRSLLKSDSFNDCDPISMLILVSDFRLNTVAYDSVHELTEKKQKSKGFFNAKKQITSMVRVLDAGCAADVDSCADFMSTAAQNLTAKENCQEEYDGGLTVVTEAYNGLMNYQTVYSATCLQDPDTDQYCYASAVTNSTDSSDSYIYFLPYDLELPGSSTPSCSWCNKETMDIYHAASADRDLLISNTYEEAARLINNLCDADFVNGTLADEVESRAMGILPSWVSMAATACLAAALGSVLY